jgi:hypothetical protein
VCTDPHTLILPTPFPGRFEKVPSLVASVPLQVSSMNLSAGDSMGALIAVSVIIPRVNGYAVEGKTEQGGY